MGTKPRKVKYRSFLISQHLKCMICDDSIKRNIYKRDIIGDIIHNMYNMYILHGESFEYISYVYSLYLKDSVMNHPKSKISEWKCSGLNSDAEKELSYLRKELPSKYSHKLMEIATYLYYEIMDK